MALFWVFSILGKWGSQWYFKGLDGGGMLNQEKRQYLQFLVPVCNALAPRVLRERGVLGDAVVSGQVGRRGQGSRILIEGARSIGMA